MNGGSAGPDTLDVSRVPNVQVISTDHGSLHGFRGTASNITGGFDNIDVIQGGSGSSLIIDDRADTSPATWTITSTTVTRQVQGQAPTTWTYGSIGNLEVDIGSGGSLVYVLSTSTATSIHDGGTDVRFRLNGLTHPWLATVPRTKRRGENMVLRK